MSAESVDAEQRNMFERHAQSVLAVVITALLLWVGNTVQAMSITIAQMKVQIEVLSSAPHPVDSQMLLAIEGRITHLESEVESMKKDLQR